MAEKNILDRLADYAKERVAESEKEKPLSTLRKEAEDIAASAVSDFPFKKALSDDGISFICECKKASPSKGLISPDFQYLDIAEEYEAAGASAVSVLTEPKWFMGSSSYLREISAAVSIPCLRKDFTVDEYMIYEAKTLGASAVLLICSILSDTQLSEYLEISRSIGLSALVEAHDANEVETAVKAGAEIIGINNRNLKDFTIDFDNSRKLRSLVPPDVLFVAESGIRNHDDVARLCEIGADAVLIGETLMRAPDKKAMLDALRGGPQTEGSV
jgi:indole-3-glycerol phosphate synthase